MLDHLLAPLVRPLKRRKEHLKKVRERQDRNNMTRTTTPKTVGRTEKQLRFVEGALKLLGWRG